MTTRRNFFRSLAAYALAPALPRVSVAPGAATIAGPLAAVFMKMGGAYAGFRFKDFVPVPSMRGPRLSELVVTRNAEERNRKFDNVELTIVGTPRAVYGPRLTELAVTESRG